MHFGEQQRYGRGFYRQRGGHRRQEGIIDMEEGHKGTENNLRHTESIVGPQRRGEGCQKQKGWFQSGRSLRASKAQRMTSAAKNNVYQTG